MRFGRSWFGPGEKGRKEEREEERGQEESKEGGKGKGERRQGKEKRKRKGRGYMEARREIKGRREGRRETEERRERDNQSFYCFCHLFLVTLHGLVSFPSFTHTASFQLAGKAGKTCCL